MGLASQSNIAGQWAHPGPALRNAPTAEFWVNQAKGNANAALKDLLRAETAYHDRGIRTPPPLADAISAGKRAVANLEMLFPREVRT